MANKYIDHVVWEDQLVHLLELMNTVSDRV